MPKIRNVEIDQVVNSGDKVLGSDVGGATRNYTLSAIAAHFRDTNAIGMASSFVYMNRSDLADEKGEMLLNSSGWANVTSLTLSAYQYDNDVDSYADGLTMLEGKDIILIQTDDQNKYGVYTAGSFSAVPGSTIGGYTLPLTYKGHKGAPTSGKLYAIQDLATDGEFTGSIKVTKNLRRTVTTVTHSNNTHTCDLSLNDNFIINANAATNTIALTVASSNIGQSGNIIINNASSGTVAFAALPSYMYTPSGATVNFVTGNDKISVISYIVLATDKVLVNYIGDFS